MTLFEDFVYKNSGKLKAQEQAVGTYLVKHEADILSLSVETIALGANVSKATVVRFCKHLGFEGFKDFRLAYSQGSFNYLDKDIKWSTPDDDVYSLLKAKTNNVLDSAFSKKTINALEKVASYIVSSSSIDIAGIGGSAITAEYLKKELTRLKLRANAYTDNYTIANDMPSMDKNTLLICISCSGASEEILELARQAKASGTTLVAMTSTDNTILEKIADVTVQVQSQVSFYDDGSYLARIGQFTTILTLSILIARKLAQQNSDLKNNFYNYTNYKNINSKENS